MDEVRYADRLVDLDRDPPPPAAPSGARPHDDDRVYEARAYDGEADILSSLMHRAVGEQIAEQRLIREALADFDHRLELLERSLVDRLAQVDHLAAERIDGFERSVTERMAAFESVLRRIVDRVTGSEERIAEGLAHNDRMMRVQLDALRPVVETAGERAAELVEQSAEVVEARLETMHRSVETAGERTAELVEQSAEVVEARLDSMHRSIESVGERTAELTAARLEKMHTAIDALAGRLAEAVDATDRRVGSIEEALESAVERLSGEITHSDRLVQAQIDALRPTIEASVMASVGPELDRTVESFRDALADNARRITRDVNRLAYLMRREGQPISGFEPVGEPARDTPAQEASEREAFDPEAFEREAFEREAFEREASERGAAGGRATGSEPMVKGAERVRPVRGSSHAVRRRRERPLRARRIPVADLVDDDEPTA